MSSPRSRRRRSAAHEEEHENHERWLLTYADMITLLMVLFIVLFAISQVDQKKFNELKTGLSTAFAAPPKPIDGGAGVLDGGKATTDDHALSSGSIDVTAEGLPAGERTSLRAAEVALAKALQQAGLSQAVSLDLEGRGLVITIVTDKVLFPSGSAQLQTSGERVLDAIAPILATLPNDLSVEGHTDDIPIATAAFPSNWELSATRATTVLRHLIDADHLAPGRLSAAGYADTRPIVPNDDAAARSRNRRVAIVVVAQEGPSVPGGSIVPPLSQPVGPAITAPLSGSVAGSGG